MSRRAVSPPHSHAGSYVVVHVAVVAVVSIHTPTRGVTNAYLFFVSGFGNVSIHTPTRGVTKVTADNFIQIKFQSTLPRGE